MRYWLPGLVALLLFPLIAGAWLVGTESGLYFLLRQADDLGVGNICISGVHGSALGPMRIESFSLETKETRYELADVRLDWSPRLFWQRHLQISQLDLGTLRITQIEPSAEPPKLPETLQLPVSIKIPRATLQKLVIKTVGNETILNDLDLSLDKPGQTYRLMLQGLTTPWGQIQGQAELDDAPPFALSGQARFIHASGKATSRATGSLTRVQLKALASLAGGQAEADILLSPFTSRPLTQAVVTASTIDPAQWDNTLPRAQISINVNLRSQGEQVYSGELTAHNGQPGSWDKDRLPLREVSARFNGTPEGMDMNDLHLDLGQGGHFQGNGRMAPAGLSLDLDTPDFDPHGLHGTLRSLRLAGGIQLKTDSEQQHLLADLHNRAYRLHLDAEHRQHIISIREAILSSGSGNLRLYGSMGLDDKKPFELAGALDRFDPTAFGNFPPARINASFSANGRLASKPEASLDFAIADSHLRRQPLSGQGNLRVSAQRIWDSAATLRLAGNRLQLRGAIGAAGDRLSFQLLGDQLSAIHPALSGQIQANGDISGSLTAPTGNIQLEAGDLAWGQDYHLGTLHTSGKLDQGLDGAMALDAQLTNLTLPGLKLEQASLSGQGRRSQHSLSLVLKNPDLDLSLDLSGALHEVAGKALWSGQIQRLANRGHYPLTLQEPAQLEIGAGQGRLGNAHILSLGSQINILEASYLNGPSGRQFASRGEFKGLSTTRIGALAKLPENLGGDLALAGAWQVNAGEHFNGRIVLERERGDLALTHTANASLGLSHLYLVAEATDDRLKASLEADGTILGRLRATGESRLSRRDDTLGISSTTPFQAQAELDLKSLAWATPFLDKTIATDLDGRLTARVQASGSLAKPHFSGTLSGDHFKLALADQGLDMTNGQFQIKLDQDTLELKSFSLQGGEGHLTGQGKLALRAGQPDLRLALKADKLQVISRPDRLLILSGDGNITQLGKQLQLNAKLKADRGLLELARDDAPKLSEDVVVLGREARISTQGLPYAVDLDLDLDLGERFFLKGRGVDAQLGGAVRLSGRKNLPLSANGSIRVVKGAYAAYGQRLDIDRGILNFQGPLDNPGLNILALRKNQEVEAGVAISGTAQAPIIKLASKPTLPDSEKLSWLVLGHGLADTGAQEFDVLQLAAGALLGAGESVTLQQRIAHAAGLEEVSLKGAGTLENTVLTLGKRLSSRAYLSYEQGLSANDTLVKINYTLTRRLSLQAQAGTTPAVDLFYTFSFD